MSKFSNLLKMIILLKSREKMKNKDLADELGVSERMIRKYINDLSEANIHVKSTQGPSGGYELIGYDFVANSGITYEELAAIELAQNYVEKQGDFELLDKLKSLKHKINIIKKSELNEDEYSGNSVIESKPVYEKMEHYIELKVYDSCITKHKIKIKYFSLNTGVSTRIIRPYSIVTRNNAQYLIGYCEEKESIRLFKILRILKIQVLEEKFQIPMSFDAKKFMKNQMGLIGGESVHIKLKIEKPFSYSVSEKVLSDNQVITWNDDECIIFEANFNGKIDTIRWILSMTTHVTIMEPIQLKEEIKSILLKMADKI